MKKTAFYADYIHYNNKLHNNSYLLVTDELIDGIYNDINEFKELKIK